MQFGRWWYDAPAGASDRVVQVTTGALYLCAAFVCAIAAALLPSFESSRTAAVALTALAAVVGLAILAFGRWLPRFFYDIDVFVALAAWVVFAYLGDEHSDPAPRALPLLFIVVAVAFLFPLRMALFEIAAIATIGGLVMNDIGAESGDIVLVMGSGLCLAVIAFALARLTDASEEDSLTGALNIRGFDSSLGEMIHGARRDRTDLSLAVVEFDFASTEHAMADEVVREAVKRWKATLPEGAEVARLGGDELALLVPGMTLGAACDLVDQLRDLVLARGSFSAGVADWRIGLNGFDLRHRAEQALYEAKQAGRNQTQPFGDSDRVATRFETGLALGEFFVVMQPVVSLECEEVTGYESLVRWEHPARGVLTPDKFIPAAERTGFVHDLGAWVLRETIRIGATLGDQSLSFSVNVSVVQLRSEAFVDEVLDALAEWPLPPRNLVLEITESVLDEDDDRIDSALLRLRRAGIRIAMDDFGSGYSSMSRLAQMPVDIVKLDGRFMESVAEGSHDAPILEGIALICRRMGLQSVVEHVETGHQAAVVRGLGFTWAQGYLYGRPVPVDEVLSSQAVGW